MTTTTTTPTRAHCRVCGGWATGMPVDPASVTGVNPDHALTLTAPHLCDRGTVPTGHVVRTDERVTPTMGGRDMRRHAASALANVTPAAAAAMTELSETDPDALAAMVTMVNAGTTDVEAAAYAVTVAPRMWLDRSNGAPMLAVVRKAIRMGERYAAMAAWDSYGDMTDAANMTDDGDARTVVSHNGTAPADSRFGVTYGDVVMTAAGMLPDADGETVRTAGRAYVRARRTYDNGDRVGRPVSLPGALAAAAGYGPDDSRYHAARRLTLAAVKRVDRGAVLALTGAPGARPTYGANRSGAVMVTPSSDGVLTAPVPARAGRMLPGGTVTVRRMVTTGYDRTDAPMAGAGDVVVWNGQRVVTVPVMAARANRWPVVDVLGYDAPGYAPVATVRTAPLFRAVREEVETVRTVAPVTVGARGMLLPTDVVVIRTADGALTARTLTDDERETTARPDARRPARLDDGETGASRPDDSPARGDLTVSGMLRSYKPVISPRYRPGGNTGSTVPARLAK